MADPNIGRILNERYHLVELLGQGSMGRVYGAQDRLLGGVSVAVKFLSQALLNQKMRDRFVREATTCALLGERSMHIVRVTNYGVDDDGGIPFYVMEYLRGESLSEMIMRQPLPLPRFINITRQVCLGLQCAHQGIPVNGKTAVIVHRDIKPSNILVMRDDTFGELAKILDFGIAKTLQVDSGQTGCFMGTLAYSSPEQMEGQELDGRSDIYSLGVMMFQMLTGKMPLNAETHSFGGWYRAHREQHPRSLIAANTSLRVPKALENLVMSCLEKLPENRPQNVGQVVQALEPLEQRFGTGWQIGKRIEATLSTVSVSATPRNPTTLSPEDICRLAYWPQSKPIGEISFPHALQTSQGPLATLWVMLNQREVQNRRICTRYNQFLFAPAPHPTLLWVTVLFNREHGARWLSSYLDLKTPVGQQMTRLLGQSGQYRILFFAKEDPKRCANVLTATIAPMQQKLLQDWATLGQMAPGTAQYSVGKNQLRDALEKLKPQILLKLESLYTDSGDFSS